MNRLTESDIAELTSRPNGPKLAKNHLSSKTRPRGANVVKSAAKAPSQKPAKYRNVKTEIDGLTFDSKKEAARWQELRILERAGEIKDLVRQTRFDLRVNGELICFYKADFVYREKLTDWRIIVEDSKGVKTRDYLIKKKLMYAIHKISIRET